MNTRLAASELPELARLTVRFANDLLSTSDHWTRYRIARNARGFSCFPYDPHAFKRCLYGSIVGACTILGWDRDVATDDVRRNTDLASEYVSSFIPENWRKRNLAPNELLEVFNDSPETKFEDVKSALSKAVEEIDAYLAERPL